MQINTAKKSNWWFNFTLKHWLGSIWILEALPSQNLLVNLFLKTWNGSKMKGAFACSPFIFMGGQDKKCCCPNISDCIHFVRFFSPFYLFILPSIEGEGWEDSASSSVCRAVGGTLWIYCCSPIENNEFQVFYLPHGNATWMQHIPFPWYAIVYVE